MQNENYGVFKRFWHLTIFSAKFSAKIIFANMSINNYCGIVKINLNYKYLLQDNFKNMMKG